MSEFKIGEKKAQNGDMQPPFHHKTEQPITELPA